MKIPISSEEEASFNMSPMIDMVFLLLIFFMIASRMSVAQNLELEIPTAKKAVVPEVRQERFVVNVVKDGGICIYGNPTPVSLDELREAFKTEKAVDPDTKIYIRADQDTDFMYIRKVMTVMAEEGLDDSIFGAFIPD